MSEGFLGEVRLFAGNYAPEGWALCHGQLLPIAENQTLYSVIGTYYGGDGRLTFALPDLRGRVPVGAGQGPGLSNFQLNQTFGTEITEFVATHVDKGDTENVYASPAVAQNNHQPSLVLNYIICIHGVFPQRSS